MHRLIWNSKRTHVRLLFQINRWMVNTIWFRFDLIRFRKNISLCIIYVHFCLLIYGTEIDFSRQFYTKILSVATMYNFRYYITCDIISILWVKIYSQTFRAQSPLNPFWIWCNMLLTGLHHSPVVSIPLLLFSNSSILPFHFPLFFSPLRARELGPIIIDMSTKWLGIQ